MSIGSTDITSNIIFLCLSEHNGAVPRFDVMLPTSTSMGTASELGSLGLKIESDSGEG